MKIACPKRILAGSLTVALLLTSGCGYFLYPERVGQTEGRVDPAVVVLDAAGLLFGIVPGAIAFAVDITTGAIYLPPGEKDVLEKHDTRLSSFDTPMRAADPAPLVDQQHVARELSGLLGEPVDQNRIHYYTAQYQDRSVPVRPAGQ